ncbi:MAG: bestrophin-like domain [Alphaproteobacteria bacterium]
MSWFEHFLASAPNWQVFGLLIALIVSAGTLLAASVYRVVRATGIELDQRSRDYAQVVYLGLFALTALMMTLSTLEARASIGKIGTTVKEEGFTIVHLDRLLMRYGPERTAEARKALADYASAVVEEDWPLMRQGGRDGSPRVYELLARLNGALGELPETHGGLVDRMIEDLNDLEQQHDDRIIAASETRLPTLFWWLIGSLGAAVCVMAGLLIVRPVGFVFLGVKLTAIALMISFLAVMDGPFRGETSVSAEPIVFAIDYLSAAH